MAADIRRENGLQRQQTTTLDPVGCRLALEGRLSSKEGLGEALRQRSEREQGRLEPPRAAGAPPGAAAPPSEEDDPGRSPFEAPPNGAHCPAPSHCVGGVGGASGGGAAPAGERAGSLHRDSQLLLDAVASEAAAAASGGDASHVPLPEQVTLMLPLAAAQEAAAMLARQGQGGTHAGPKAEPGACRGADAPAGDTGLRLAGKPEHCAAPDGPAPPDPGPAAPRGTAAAAVQQPQPQPAGAAEAPASHPYCDAAVHHPAAPAADEPAPPGAAPRDPCTCPPFAVKATCGKRSIMEDTYALCPNICELPMPPMAADFADKLPQRIAVQLANGDPAGDDAGEHTPAATPPPGAPPCDGSGGGGGGALFGASVDAGGGGGAGGGAAGLEKLHFFGVYDGHGGMQASQHCAARLHHHLSAALREMAAALRAQAVVSSVELAASLEEAPGAAWEQPMVPEVQFVSVFRARADGVSPRDASADDCGIPAAAAAAPAGVAGGGGGTDGGGVAAAPEVSAEDEDALRALSRESSGERAREAEAARAGGGGGGEGEGEGEGEVDGEGKRGGKPRSGSGGASPRSSGAGSSGGGDEAGSADGSEGASTSTCALLEEALREAFLKTDEEFSADGTAGLVGSTAVCALVGTHRVWIANCGDSRAVLCRGGQAVQVTDDHKPERADEAERVEKAGGQVLYWNGHRVMGVLAMSRAIGDHCLRPYVIPEPEITVFRRHSKDEILLLASDGLWDVMPNQEATDLAMRCIRRARDKGASPKAAARVAAAILTKAAVDRGSRDNITVMVIDLSRGAAQGEAQSGGGGGGAPEAAAAAPPGGRGGGDRDRLAAAAAAAEAAGDASRRPVPQRIMPGAPAPGAAQERPPQKQEQQQQQQQEEEEKRRDEGRQQEPPPPPPQQQQQQPPPAPAPQAEPGPPGELTPDMSIAPAPCGAGGRPFSFPLAGPSPFSSCEDPGLVAQGGGPLACESSSGSSSGAEAPLAGAGAGSGSTASSGSGRGAPAPAPAPARPLPGAGDSGGPFAAAAAAAAAGGLEAAAAAAAAAEPAGCGEGAAAAAAPAPGASVTRQASTSPFSAFNFEPFDDGPGHAAAG